MRQDTQITVVLSDQKVSDYKWLTKVSDIIKLLPHGSGFDAEWKIEEDNDSRYFSNSYHAMDGNGMYSGWLAFTVEVPKGIRSNKWYYEFDIEFDPSDLDYDDGSEEESEIVLDASDYDEDGNQYEYDNPAVNLESLQEYIESVISESLTGIVRIAKKGDK